MINRSVLGSEFKAKIIKETKVGKFPAIVPEVSGTAYVTGFNQLVVDDRDPYPTGFRIR